MTRPLIIDFILISFLFILSFLFVKSFSRLLFSFQCSLFSELTFKVHSKLNRKATFLLLRKEVIHPHVPVGIPCYDFTPIISPTLDSSFLAVRPPASGVTNSHGVTGGVYKARERIHRGMLIRDY